jgi:hypothetical protein
MKLYRETGIDGTPSFERWAELSIDWLIKNGYLEPVPITEEEIEIIKQICDEFKSPDWEIHCDHSVGICYCSLIAQLEKLLAIYSKLKGE